MISGRQTSNYENLKKKRQKRTLIRVSGGDLFSLLIEINCGGEKKKKKKLRKGNVFLGVNCFFVKDCTFILFWALSKKMCQI